MSQSIECETLHQEAAEIPVHKHVKSVGDVEEEAILVKMPSARQGEKLAQSALRWDILQMYAKLEFRTSLEAQQCSILRG